MNNMSYISGRKSDVGSVVDEEVIAPIMTTQVPELRVFYGSASVPRSHGAVYDPKGMSSNDNSMGVWFVKAMRSQCVHLNVESFVIEVKAGGISVPKIAPVDDYIAKFVQDGGVTEATSDAATGAVQSKPREKFSAGEEQKDERPAGPALKVRTAGELAVEVERAKGRLLEAEVDEASLRKILESPSTRAATERSPEEVAALRVQLAQARARVDALDERLQTRMEKYESACATAIYKEESAMTERKKKDAEMTAQARLKHQEDSNALIRLEQCLELLKQWVVAQLAKGCSSLESCCRTYTGGKDPLQSGNMRGIWKNLQHRYRNSSEMGVTATTVKYIREALLETRSLSQHLRAMEEMSAVWDELGFSETSKEHGQTIVCMIFAAGMKEADRNAYMAEEETADLVCERLARASIQDGSDEAADGAELLRRSQAKVSPYERLVTWGKRMESQAVVQGSFANKDKHGGKKTTPHVTEDPQVFLAEQQRPLSSPAPCWNYRRGKCERGSHCRFSHTAPVNAAQPDVPKPSPGTGTSGVKQSAAPRPDPKPAKKTAISTPQLPAAPVMSASYGDLSDGEGNAPDTPGGYVVLTAAVQKSSRVALNWDTATMMHIANDMSILENPRPNVGTRGATGIGGPAEMTHIGNSRVLGLQRMRLISRVKIDGPAAAVDLLSKAGLAEDTIVEAAKRGTISGLPETITPAAVKKYFNQHGKGLPAIEAGITRPVMRAPLGHLGEVAKAPGETLMMDNVDSPFARQEVVIEGSSPPRTQMKQIRSIHGFVDVVLAQDEYSGYVFVAGRKSKKDPHLVVRDLVERWVGRWRALKCIKCDAEFVTAPSLQLAAAQGLRVYQAPPGQHAMVQGGMESTVRWIGEGAQANMNRLQPLVGAGIITEDQRAKLWFHAILHAVTAHNLKPVKASTGAVSKTRLEEGTGKHVSLSTTVMLPFGMPLVGKKLRNDGAGRGMRCIYLGASSTVPGGILVLNPSTDKVSVLYQFLPIPQTPGATPEEERAAAVALYHGLETAVRAESGEFGPGSELDSARRLIPWPEQGLPEIAAPPEPPRAGVDGEDQIDARVSEAGTRARSAPEVTPTPEVDRSELPYQTRNIARRVLSVEAIPEAVMRPPKPKVPSSRERKEDPRWAAAYKREAAKLLDADTFAPIPRDDEGKEILPENVMVHHLLPRCEYKWKKDPETGIERWLECVRCVSDGSVDHREDIRCYAETPERTLLFVTLGLSASTGEWDATADVERAYLNADSLDKNILIVAPPEMVGLPRRSILRKGLYGERKASLGWEIFIDKVLLGLGWRKLDVCRGMYRKDLPDGGVARCLRHSDDLRMTAPTKEALQRECGAISSEVKMSSWEPVSRFLGVEIERVSLKTGKPDPLGEIVLVRQREKIAAMRERFKGLDPVYNRNNRVRRTPGPLNLLKSVEDMSEAQAQELSDEDAKVYEQLVGCFNWIVGARPEFKFQNLVQARKGFRPLAWDLYCACWEKDYLIASIDRPLVLGGPVVDPQATSDSSFATMEESRTVLGYGLTTGPLSGAVEAESKLSKCAMTSVWETELAALAEATKAQEFITHACEELGYDLPEVHQVFTDNMGVRAWVKGDASNRRSRHIDVRLHYVRHAEREGRVTVEYVPTKENYADVLTKAFSPGNFEPLAARILGHFLVQGLEIPGVIELGEK